MSALPTKAPRSNPLLGVVGLWASGPGGSCSFGFGGFGPPLPDDEGGTPDDPGTEEGVCIGETARYHPKEQLN